MALPAKQDMGSSLDLVDVKEIKENTVILKDGGLRQVIMVGGVNFSLKSESEQNIITGAYQTFLNSIDFPLQVLVHSRKVNIDKYIETLTQRKGLEESPILQSQIDEYAEFIKGFVQKNAIMEKVFLVVIPYYPIAKGTGIKSSSSPFSFFSRKKPDAAAQAKSDEEVDLIFRENLAQLNQRTSQAMSGILGMGLEATLLGYEQLVELFYNFYNPQTVERQNMPVPRD